MKQDSFVYGRDTEHQITLENFREFVFNDAFGLVNANTIIEYN